MAPGKYHSSPTRNQYFLLQLLSSWRNTTTSLLWFSNPRISHLFADVNGTKLVSSLFVWFTWCWLPTVACIEFRRRIRDYNNALSFASMSANVDHSVAGQKGIYTVWVGGQLHHKMGSLFPSQGMRPAFSQIYLLGDGGTGEAEMRQAYHNHNLNPLILGNLQELLIAVNPYAALFKNARTVSEQSPHSTIVLKSLEPGNRHDFKRYNQPKAQDIGAVIEGTGDLDFSSREVVLHRQTGDLVQIDDMNTNFLPTRYVLLFPRGVQGWDQFYVSPTRTRPVSDFALASDCTYTIFSHN